MKRVIFLMITLMLVFYFTACEEYTQGADLRKNWQYTAPHFDFKYPSDTIYFGSASNQMNMAVSDFKHMFLGMAGSKMGNYFKGIDIYSFDSLSIKAQRATGEPMHIRAAYFNDAHYIELELDKRMMGALMGAGASMIPTISFQYTLQEGNLILFFDEVYVQSIFENVQIQNRLVPMIARSLNPMYDRMPAPAQQAMAAGIQKQLSAIVDDFQEMKLGFILK